MVMTAEKLNLKIDQGSTFSLTISVKDDAGALVDLTDHTFEGQIRKQYDSATVLGEFTFTPDPNQVTNKGKLTISMTDEETGAIPADPSIDYKLEESHFVYDLKRINLSGQAYRIRNGYVEFSPQVTK